MKNKKLYIIIAILITLLVYLDGKRVISYFLRNTGNINAVTHGPYYKMKASMFEAMTRTEGNIVFLGDSITDWVNFEDFFPFKITNRGIAGDTTIGVLARLDEIISLKPSKLFILIGTNDISYGSSPEKIAGNIRKIISRVQENSQGTKIYVQSLFPRSDMDFSVVITAINHELENISRELGCEYINLYPLLLSSEGLLDRKFTFDGLHLNGPAVSEWMKFVAPYVNE